MKIGIKGKTELVVTEDKTAKFLGSGNLNVFATPAMIAMMENTCMKSVEQHLEDFQSTVGTYLDIKHIAASPMGATIRCESELVSVDRRKLSFKVQAFDNKELIGEGLHERFIVDVDKFMDKISNKINF